ncbi:MAG: VOC family protein [Planctomycetota bacterium]|jgi:catechol 2,3-dioxygenase-like lactoylglutathione lyase family enzyme
MIKHLDHLNISVADFERTADWYRRVFGFEVAQDEVDGDGIRWGVLKAGEALLCIYEYPDHKMVKARLQGQHGINHFGLRITDRAAWEQVLEREQLETHWGSPVDWPHSTAWYVRDPTGWEIEVALWNNDTVAFG